MDNQKPSKYDDMNPMDDVKAFLKDTAKGMCVAVLIGIGISLLGSFLALIGLY